MFIECDLYNGKVWRIVELSDVDQSDERGYRICSQLYIEAANVDLITAKLNDDCLLYSICAILKHSSIARRLPTFPFAGIGGDI